jgi:hypothetical protein
MTIRADEEEDYVVRRLLRERRSGEVARLDATHWRFTASVYDPYELLPWVRTFIGRVVRFDCDDRRVVERFQQDLRAMRAMYGGDDAV